MSVGAVNKQTGERIPTAGMPAIDDALDLTSVNPVQNGIITAALADKQDKTDNSLQTTDKTVVGAINEHEGDIDSLKSGLTNYEATTNAALAMPENTGKNVLPYPFSETTKTVNGVTFTDNGDGTISTSGQATERTIFYIKNANANLHIPAGTYTVSKSYQNAYTVLNVDGYNGNTWVKSLAKSSSTDDVTITVDYDGYDRITMYLEIGANINTDNLIFKPMIRPATITDSTFAPYIPSVDSRIEAVESGLNNLNNRAYYISTWVEFNYYNAGQLSGTYTVPTLPAGWSYRIVSVGNIFPNSDLGVKLSGKYLHNPTNREIRAVGTSFEATDTISILVLFEIYKV